MNELIKNNNELDKNSIIYTHMQQKNIKKKDILLLSQLLYNYDTLETTFVDNSEFIIQ